MRGWTTVAAAGAGASCAHAENAKKAVPTVVQVVTKVSRVVDALLGLRCGTRDAKRIKTEFIPPIVGSHACAPA